MHTNILVELSNILTNSTKLCIFLRFLGIGLIGLKSLYFVQNSLRSAFLILVNSFQNETPILKAYENPTACIEIGHYFSLQEQ